jgi:hypothetical protein
MEKNSKTFHSKWLTSNSTGNATGLRKVGRYSTGVIYLEKII